MNDGDIQIPRSEERGPIEATRAAPWTSSAGWIPRSEERGPIEAVVVSYGTYIALYQGDSALRRARPH